MSENPTNPAPPATESGEKMIPLCAVEPLIRVAAWMLTHQSFPPELVSAYELAQRAAGNHDDRPVVYVISGYAERLAAAQKSIGSRGFGE